MNKEFYPRDYQKPFCDAVKNGEKKRFMGVWPRRAGKTFCAWQTCLDELKNGNGIVHWISSTYEMGRRSLWEGRSNEGKPWLNSISAADLKEFDNNKMFFELRNGSVFQIFSSDKYFSQFNPTLIVIDEPALCDERVFELLDNDLFDNHTKVILLGTPHRPEEGIYWFKVFYERALENKDDWFVSHLTVDDTKHVTLKEVAEALNSRGMTQELIDEEFGTIFKEAECMAKRVAESDLRHSEDWPPPVPLPLENDEEGK